MLSPLSLLFIAGSLAQNLPDLCHYPDIQQGTVCYRYSPFQKTRTDAQNYCESIGYSLIEIKSEQVEQMHSFNANRVVSWMGLRCEGSSPDSCYWGNQTNPKKLNSNSFTKFAPGHPNIQFGECVTFDCTHTDPDSENKSYPDCYWLSADCSQVHYFTCSRSAFYKVGEAN